MPEISVIIPVYNVENYLYICIESVVNQSYKDIEIILINDGSDDKSLNICQYWANKDSRIQVINNKENKGVSKSRTRGLSVAKGKYIIFVDADDILKVDMIECMIEHIEECDAIGINYFVFDSNKDFNDRVNSSEIIKCSFSELLQFRRGYFCCGILYKKSIIDENNMKFDENLNNLEDVVWNSIYGVYATNCIFIAGEYYGYRIREGSITSNCKNIKWQICSWINALVSLKKYKCKCKWIKKKKIAKEIRRCKNNIHAELFWGKMGIKELRNILHDSNYYLVSLYFEFLPYRLLFALKNSKIFLQITQQLLRAEKYLQ